MNPIIDRLIGTAETVPGVTVTVFNENQAEARNAKGKRIRFGASSATVIVYRPDGPGPKVETGSILKAEAEVLRALTDNRTVGQARRAFLSGDRMATRALKEVRYRVVNGIDYSPSWLATRDLRIAEGGEKRDLAAARLIELGAW